MVNAELNTERKGDAQRTRPPSWRDAPSIIGLGNADIEVVERRLATETNTGDGNYVRVPVPRATLASALLRGGVGRLPLCHSLHVR